MCTSQAQDPHIMFAIFLVMSSKCLKPIATDVNALYSNDNVQTVHLIQQRAIHFMVAWQSS